MNKELKDRLKKILEKDYGITDDAGLMEALKGMPGIDIGIFASPMKEGVKSA